MFALADRGSHEIKGLGVNSPQQPFGNFGIPPLVKPLSSSLDLPTQYPLEYMAVCFPLEKDISHIELGCSAASTVT